MSWQKRFEEELEPEPDGVVCCLTCKMLLNGPSQLEYHLRGPYHRRQLRKQREARRAEQAAQAEQAEQAAATEAQGTAEMAMD